jgi:hypothetical protein
MINGFNRGDVSISHFINDSANPQSVTTNDTAKAITGSDPMAPTPLTYTIVAQPAPERSEQARQPIRPQPIQWHDSFTFKKVTARRLIPAVAVSQVTRQ